MRAINEVFHDGEIKAQTQFNDSAQEGAVLLKRINRMYLTALNEPCIDFLKKQTFFFIATSNPKGECDCSFRGTEMDENNTLYESLKILGKNQLVFPDYTGNNMYNSLGNIISNPNIGMLFIDFNKASRLRVNGVATIIDNKESFEDIWPMAHRYITVDIKSVFWNCSRRIKESVNL